RAGSLFLLSELPYLHPFEFPFGLNRRQNTQ
ncbi:hypothetical protein TrRE_jg12468, partial [Triparma retinervis]